MRWHHGVAIGIVIVFLALWLDFHIGFPLAGYRRTLQVNVGVVIITVGILALFLRHRKRRDRLGP